MVSLFLASNDTDSYLRARLTSSIGATVLIRANEIVIVTTFTLVTV